MSKTSAIKTGTTFLSSTWPVLKKYEGHQLDRIAMPLGGIGTGTISLGGRGQLQDWEIGNRPAKGFSPKNAFFALYARPSGEAAVVRALEGALLPHYEGARGSVQPMAGLPRFRDCKFFAAYPLGQVVLSDAEVPVQVRMEAFNPLIPGDAESSGIPVLALRFVLRNKTNKRVEAAVCGNLSNFLGQYGPAGKPGNNSNRLWESKDGKYRGVILEPRGLDESDELFGTMSMVTDAPKVSRRTAWETIGWNADLLEYWDDFSEDGELEECSPGIQEGPMASVAGKLSIPAGGERSVTFLVSWHFPNRMTWYPSASPEKRDPFVTDFAPRFEISDFFSCANSLQGVAFSKAIAWKTTVSVNKAGFANIREQICSQGKKARGVFFRTTFTCVEAMSLVAHLGYDGPVVVWVDGKEIFRDATGTNPAGPEDAQVPFAAGRGNHEVVIALSANHGAAWGIFLRLERVALSKGAANVISLPVFSGTVTTTAPSDGNEEACCDGGQCCGGGHPDWVGNFYCNTYKNAWDVIEKTVPRLAALEKDTVAFVRDFCASDLPDVVKEAALFNISTLRSQTTFRIPEGHLFGWEGCDDAAGCCHGSCTHVWNYENAIPFLFGDLSRSMREVEFAHATDEQGMMCFRVNLPLDRAKEWKHAAADGQMGCLMRLYRDWKICGDEEFLRALWPHARRALEFCWIPGGWDGDRDGVMEGCQHNTMDVEYYGPNPQMELWYLGALRACEEMAAYLGESEFAQQCRELFLKGRAWTDANLFNGEYYEHHYQPPEHPEAVAECLKVGMGSSKDFQLGSGCLVDQLVGQYMAHAAGLGYLLRPKNIQKTLKSIKKYNFLKSFYNHFNHMRSYVLNDESALLMASYPRGERPKYPFPYFTEVMTGFEYTAAVGMLQEGLLKDGLECITAIRNRYDGVRRSPFDEAECGHHYSRTMASWAAVLSLTGFHYSGVERLLKITDRAGTYFWSHGEGWGRIVVSRRDKKLSVKLSVTRGSIALRRVLVGRSTAFDLPREVVVTRSRPLVLSSKSSSTAQ